jgi:glycerophosphoryl diester phosphodiesterase
LALSVAAGVSAVELDVIGYPGTTGEEGTGQLLISHDVSATRGTNVEAVLRAECARDASVSTFCSDGRSGTDYRQLSEHQLSMIRRPVDGSSLQMLPEFLDHYGRLWRSGGRRIGGEEELPTAMVEVKRVGWHKAQGIHFMTRTFVDVVREYEATVRIVAASFEEAVLREMRSTLHSPASHIRLLYDAQAAAMKVSKLPKVAEYAEAVGVSVAHLNGRSDAQAFVQAAHKAGIAVYVFVVSPRNSMQPYAAQLDYLVHQLGVDGLITDHVRETNGWIASSYSPPATPRLTQLDVGEGRIVQLPPTPALGSSRPRQDELTFIVGTLAVLLCCLLLLVRHRRRPKSSPSTVAV